MESHLDMAPFEICKESVLYKGTPFPGWKHEAGTEKRKDPQHSPQKRALVWLAAITVLGTTICCFRFFRAENDAAFTQIEVQKEANERLDSAATSGLVDLGMVLMDIRTDQAAVAYHVSKQGVYVLAVIKEGLAELAGVQSGDCILKIGSTVVSNTADINDALSLLKLPSMVKLTILRGRDTLELPVNVESPVEQL